MALLLPRVAVRLLHKAATERSEVDLSLGAFQNFAAARQEVLYTDRWVCAVSEDNRGVDAEMSIDLFSRLPHVEWQLKTPPSRAMRRSCMAQRGSRGGSRSRQTALHSCQLGYAARAWWRWSTSGLHGRCPA